MSAKKQILVNNRMQKGYRYILSEPIGKNFDPRFTPELTPKQMLALGVFGGVYMRDSQKEFPRDWFTDAKLQKEGVYTQDKTLNYFGVKASQSLSVWKEKGWIFKDDPRGWFEWYCRYYMGRRIPEEDDRQIKRWIAIRRHGSQILKYCRAGDTFCRPRQRQAMLHWAYDSRLW